MPFYIRGGLGPVRYSHRLGGRRRARPGNTAADYRALPPRREGWHPVGAYITFAAMGLLLLGVILLAVSS